VGPDGPLEVYHGTSTLQPFTEFALEMIGDRNPEIASGFHFSNTKAEAEEYATLAARQDADFGEPVKGRVVAAFLKIERPYRVNTDLPAFMQADELASDIQKKID